LKLTLLKQEQLYGA